MLQVGVKSFNVTLSLCAMRSAYPLGKIVLLGESHHPAFKNNGLSIIKQWELKGLECLFNTAICHNTPTYPDQDKSRRKQPNSSPALYKCQ